MVKKYKIRNRLNEKFEIRIEVYRKKFSHLKYAVLKVKVANRSCVFTGETYYEALKKLMDFLEQEGMVLEW